MASSSTTSGISRASTTRARSERAPVAAPPRSTSRSTTTAPARCRWPAARFRSSASVVVERDVDRGGPGCPRSFGACPCCGSATERRRRREWPSKPDIESARVLDQGGVGARIAPADQFTVPLLASVRVIDLNPSVSIVGVAPEAIVVVPVSGLDAAGPLEAARHGQVAGAAKRAGGQGRLVIVGLVELDRAPGDGRVRRVVGAGDRHRAGRESDRARSRHIRSGGQVAAAEGERRAGGGGELPVWSSASPPRLTVPLALRVTVPSLSNAISIVVVPVPALFRRVPVLWKRAGARSRRELASHWTSKVPAFSIMASRADRPRRPVHRAVVGACGRPGPDRRCRSWPWRGGDRGRAGVGLDAAGPAGSCRSRSGCRCRPACRRTG